MPGRVRQYGYGTRAIGDVLGGAAPVGATAYSSLDAGIPCDVTAAMAWCKNKPIRIYEF